MHNEHFDHSPPQSTLTQNKWIDTRKVGKDDDEIRRVQLRVESDRKSKRKRDKPFTRAISVGVVRAAAEVCSTEISALSTTEVLEAQVYESSDPDFESKIVRGRVLDEEDETNTTPHKTPTKKERRHANTNNQYSIINKDLRKHIEMQNRTIADLRRKLEIIRNVSSDAEYTDTRKMLRDRIKTNSTTDSQINIRDVMEDDTARSPMSDSRNVINLHFS